MQKRLFILSAQAGDGRPLQYEQLIRGIYQEAGMQDAYEIKVTLCPEDTKNFTRQFTEELQEKLSSFDLSHSKMKGFDYPCIYILGGDGSISEVCNALMEYERRPALGCIPAGTANDLVKTWGIFAGQNDELRNKIAHELVSKSLKPQFEPFDLIAFSCDDEKVQKAYSSNIIGLGIDSQILKDAYRFLTHIPRYPNLAFGAAIAKTIGKNQGYKLKFELEFANGETLSYTSETVLTTISNGQYYGNGYNPTPSALTHDGLIDFISAQPVSRTTFIRLVGALKKGTHLKTNKFYHNDQVLSGKICSLSGPLPANFDGRLLTFSEIEFKVVHHALLRAF